ncbi:hypothetical protein CEY16_08230 [Halalkalibacillus sediminis]|uniref:Gram-positive cocci surface proteins LPxTG domain-containing protein n=1 Tax=Halalkalibacillus sediminis TaxID=2018042 RepID=A0A2I0QUC7_9BACI|nr:SpaH/EbpB family LPXTG-anchored major pilin [Halalkalibacillus sediminis]PKR77904.1 hypothetical protein CEY16_08230 [Halalkalibacillus sediminis]
MNKKWFSVSMILALIFSLLVPVGALSAVDNDNVYQRETGSLMIHKYSLEADEMDDGVEGNGEVEQFVPSDAEPLEGVTFKITRTHSFNPFTDEWSEDPGAPIEVITDSTGVALFGNLPLGRYMVEETDGPDFVNLNEDTYYVDIPMTNEEGTELNYDVHIFPKNDVIRGSVNLFKMDRYESALEGVKFALYKVVDDGEDQLINGELMTDAYGKIHVDELMYGDYYFIELEPANGYVGTGETMHSFSVESSGEVDPVWVTNYKIPEIDKQVNGGDSLEINREENFTYTLHIDLPGDIGSYNSFVISDQLDPMLHFEGVNFVEADGVDVESALSFDNTNNLLSWSATDFSALSGKSELIISFDASIMNDAEGAIENKGELEFENEYEVDGDVESDITTVTPTIGSIQVTKFAKDDDPETANPLDGAKFQLKDSEGNDVDGVHSGVNGVFNWDRLDYGTYYLHEVEAPDGYRLLTQPIEIIVGEGDGADGVDVEMNVFNSESDWELPATGGIGTSIFTAIGLALMVLALGLYLRRRNQMA